MNALLLVVPWRAAFVALDVALFDSLRAFVLAPLVLGVPHLVIEARYLVIGQALPRWLVRVLGALAILLIAIALWPMPPVLRAELELLLASLGIAVGAFAGIRQTRAPAILVAIAPLCAVLAIGAVFAPVATRSIVTTLHNLVAFVALGALAGGAAAWMFACVAVSIGAASTIALCRADWFFALLSQQSAFGMSLPVVALTKLHTTSVLLFWNVFAQLLHYVAWLVLIPLAVRVRPRSDDKNAYYLIAIIVGMAACLVGLSRAPMPSRDLYLSFASFHVLLELAVLTFLLCRSAPLARLLSSSEEGRP